MSDWYCSSAAHAAVPVFAISTPYTVGQFVRRITSTLKAQWVFRVTVAGTSAGTEPTWPTANNGTVVSGGATFQNVSGQSAYGWSAAAGDLATLLTTSNRLAGDDRVFISSDHTETQTTATDYGSGVSAASSFAVIQFLCVNRAGSVPPVAADLTTGANIIVSAGAGLNLTAESPCYHYGITYQYSGTSTGIRFTVGTSTNKFQYFQNCVLWLNTATALNIFANTFIRVTLDNTQVRFGAAGQQLGQNGTAGIGWDLVWLNTATPLPGTAPTILFRMGTNNAQTTCRGLDLSAVTGTLVICSGANGHKWLFDSCRIASGVTRYSLTGIANCFDELELVNCFDGTNIISERYQPAGAVTTERTITLSGGATDDVGTFSHKMVSGTNIDKYANTLNSFWVDVEYQTTGASKTATVEIISSASLNNDEISLLLEYQGTSGSSLTSFATTMPATVLTAAAAVTTSTATWNASPGTPVKQKLEVTFTPNTAGRVRGQVRLGKPSATVYFNPVITIT